MSDDRLLARLTSLILEVAATATIGTAADAAATVYPMDESSMRISYAILNPGSSRVLHQLVSSSCHVLV